VVSPVLKRIPILRSSIGRLFRGHSRVHGASFCRLEQVAKGRSGLLILVPRINLDGQSKRPGCRSSGPPADP
jgi:hypothetical protein